jgi:hypothetical protein
MQLLDRTLRSRVLLFTGVVACTMLVANGANLLSTRSLSRTSGNALEGTLPAQRALGTVSSGLALPRSSGHRGYAAKARERQLNSVSLGLQ